MSSQLDILALEPFYGGIRRHMLESLMRYSRHRWTLFKLPPRRMERRLAAAAHWFSEQLSRHWVGRFDVLFTSEAMNLADLVRLMPALGSRPSVVYFHSNQLPDPTAPLERAVEMANLNTASVATEVWFNSMYHLKTFIAHAAAIVDGHPELSSRTPVPNLVAKAQLIRPPVEMDLDLLSLSAGPEPIARRKRAVFLDTRDANMELLNTALGTLARRKEPFELITVGPAEELSVDLPRRTLGEDDDVAHRRALCVADVCLSAKIGAACDYHGVRALSAGCWPVWPNAGVYPELLPKGLHSACLYEASADELVGRLLDVWYLERPSGHDEELQRILQEFDAVTACRVIDQRLEHLAAARVAGSHAKG